MKKEPVIDRIERWYDYSQALGIRIDRILIHPDDKAAAPDHYEGLPVVALGESRR